MYKPKPRTQPSVRIKTAKEQMFDKLRLLTDRQSWDRPHLESEIRTVAQDLSLTKDFVTRAYFMPERADAHNPEAAARVFSWRLRRYSRL